MIIKKLIMLGTLIVLGIGMTNGPIVLHAEKTVDDPHITSVDNILEDPIDYLKQVSDRTQTALEEGKKRAIETKEQVQKTISFLEKLVRTLREILQALQKFFPLNQESPSQNHQTEDAA